MTPSHTNLDYSGLSRESINLMLFDNCRQTKFLRKKSEISGHKVDFAIQEKLCSGQEGRCLKRISGLQTHQTFNTARKSSTSFLSKTRFLSLRQTKVAPRTLVVSTPGRFPIQN
ncbi:hypothetical protein M8J77_020843 [Diaphorina citri]|nr:hypothetical protein M8J77_020843 [Diaphorina citri]